MTRHSARRWRSVRLSRQCCTGSPRSLRVSFEPSFEEQVDLARLAGRVANGDGDAEEMRTVHALVHPHRKVENDGYFLAWRDCRGTHDGIGRSAAIQDFDRRAAKRYCRVANVSQPPLPPNGRVQSHPPEVGHRLDGLHTGYCDAARR